MLLSRWNTTTSLINVLYDTCLTLHFGNIFTSARKLDERSFYVALDSDKKAEDSRMRCNHFTFKIAFLWESLKEIRNKLAKKHHFMEMEITNLFWCFFLLEITFRARGKGNSIPINMLSNDQFRTPWNIIQLVYSTII